MTVAEVASVLKLNQQTVRNWIDAGKLPAAVRVGKPGATSMSRGGDARTGPPVGSSAMRRT
jgi:excisionase family DNA binding protein